jgi:chemotaxis protein methyltransferase CheR
MVLLSHLPGWEVDVYATDISTRVLETARAGVWPIEKCREIPERYLKAFMLRGTGEHRGYMKAAPELRDVVRFQRLNLHGCLSDAEGAFDLIFCRNVLIYFSPEGRALVVNRLLGRLAAGGRLLLGHAETLNGITNRLRSGDRPSTAGRSRRVPDPRFRRAPARRTSLTASAPRPAPLPK